MSSEPKTRPTDVRPVDFIAALAEPRRRADAEAMMTMLGEISGEPAVMWGPSIVGFGRYSNVTASAKPMDWPRLGFSPRKAALTVYLVPGFQEPAERMARLGPHTSSVSCLYIKRLDRIDMGVLRELCEASWAEMARRYPA